MAKIGDYYVIDPLLRTQGLPICGEGSDFAEACSDDLYVNDKQQINTDSPAFKKVYFAAKTDKAKRDELLTKMLVLSVEICKKHQGDILGTSTGLNIGFGTLTSIFSGLGTAISDVTTKTGLSAAATISNSERSLVNDEVYLNAYATAIVRAINIGRQNKREIIDKRISKDGPAIYSIDQGILDVQEYHSSCSFKDGLLVVSAALEHRKPSKLELQSKIDFLRTNLTEIEKSIEISKDPILKASKNKSLQAILDLMIQIEDVSE